MSRLSRLLILCLPLSLALCGCRGRTSGTSAQPYIRIEPSQKTASGGMTMQQGATEQDLGIAFYPGAQVNKSGLVSGAKGKVAGAELQTTHPYAEVVTFYRRKYAAQKPTVRLREGAETATLLNWQDLHGNYTVVIRRDPVGKRTVITLAKTSK